jgi:Hint domain-containing protein
VLVPAEHLVNGVTIEQAQDVDWLEYFHIELDSHDVIFAEGAPAETYVDCDNRGMFQNDADHTLLYPGDESPRWQFCAPRLEWDAQELPPIRARLLERAATLTLARDSDPVLHLVADGKTIWPASVDDRRYRFIVPASSAAVWLGSRSTVPAATVAESDDIRRLGVPVERIVLCDSEMSVEISHSHAALHDGFHPDEGSHRWTDGLARLPASWLGVLAGDFTLEVQLALSSLDYRVEPLQAAA